MRACALPAPRESAIQAAILRALELRSDVFAWRNNSGGLYDRTGRFVRFGRKGSADILGVVKGGRLLCLEVKRPGTTTTAEQVAFGMEVEEMGGFYAVVRSASEALDAVERCRRGEAR